MLRTSTLPPTAAGGAAAEASAAPAEAATVAAKAKRAAKKSASGGAPPTSADAARVLLERGVVAGLVRAIGAGRSTATARRSSAAGYASGTTATAAKTESLAFLRDPKLSIEEKLIKLLGYLNAKWDRELQEKLDKIGAGEGAAKTTASKPKKKGLLGSIAGAFSSALGGAGSLLDVLKVPAVKTALKKLGGPVLAAAASALGLPAAAPILLKYGPSVVEAAMGLASAAASGQGGPSKTSQSTSTSGAAMSESERQTVVMEIQNIRAKQQEMFSLVSNILKANHDTRSAIINNIR